MASRVCTLTIALAAAALAAGCFDFGMPDRAEADCLDDDSDACWQRLSPAETMSWADALDYCDNMGLGGLDWRFPDIDELRGLVDGCDDVETGGACAVTEECLASSCATAECAGCASGGGEGYAGCYWDQDVEGACYCYWSSSTYDDSSMTAWTVDFSTGSVAGRDKSDWCYARCVADTSSGE